VDGFNQMKEKCPVPWSDAGLFRPEKNSGPWLALGFKKNEKKAILGAY
jgi:hypothetical protein